MLSEEAHPLVSSIDEEAIEWVVRLTSGEASADTVAQYQAWADRSPEHAQAAANARALWIGLGKSLPSLPAEPPAPPTLAPGLAQPDARRSKRRSLQLSLAASVLVAVLMGTLYGYQRHDQNTEVGQQRLITLSDGSHVQLDTDTALDINFAVANRHISLARGEAYFDVQHNPQRPFIVDAGFGQIRVLGTAFSVRRDADNIWVTVTRGKVQVSSNAVHKPLYLTANQQLHFSETDRDPHINHVDTEQVLAWRTGQIQYENGSLGEVLQQLQRYDRRYWIIDKELADSLRISTSINLNNIDEWLKGLQTTLPLKVTQLGPIVWLRRNQTL
ncbi:FecR family protein [Pseudomonas cuatrocienegasensis]|uniref:FecR family protein n=1 Tax=Pseudomonas cuatrocienegasensis TaxID=543360 RepID=A0ABY1B9Z7_9PSED|nr:MULTISPECIES: FecR family protein [Pseudomonas]OEC35387.1 hypothetical protein A7D25_09730 [Pseudomonas sp. 21C1]SEQ34318.1 FecR family protein [Pseudomonas cuatrocienegasensis]